MSLADTDKQTLRQLALDSIQYSLEHGHDALLESTLAIKDFPDALQNNRATFVTLDINHDLRGCIGTLKAYQPLVIDIVQNARSAAFRDPRFTPLSKTEFKDLEIHLSVLSIPEPLLFDSEEDLLKKIRPGIDGLILTANHQQGTFLPSVWESLPITLEFWSHLKNKAGLPANYWENNIKVDRYTTESF